MDDADAHAPPIFTRILCGADGTPESLVAVRQGVRLQDADGVLYGRAAGMLLGTVAARMLRDAPCSVLIARAARDPETWPRSVVAGVDGSAESSAAFSVARFVAERFGASMRAATSSGDQFDRAAAQAITSVLEEQPGRAVDVLAAASESADLVIVGRGGLHGLTALRSVSERVAHQARSSVLVVRA